MCRYLRTAIVLRISEKDKLNNCKDLDETRQYVSANKNSYNNRLLLS